MDAWDIAEPDLCNLLLQMFYTTGETTLATPVCDCWIPALLLCRSVVFELGSRLGWVACRACRVLLYRCGTQRRVRSRMPSPSVSVSVSCVPPQGSSSTFRCGLRRSSRCSRSVRSTTTKIPSTVRHVVPPTPPLSPALHRIFPCSCSFPSPVTAACVCKRRRQAKSSPFDATGARRRLPPRLYGGAHGVALRGPVRGRVRSPQRAGQTGVQRLVLRVLSSALV